MTSKANVSAGPCACGTCEMCTRRAAIDLDALRENAAQLAHHAGLPDLAGRALAADAELCAKIISTAATTLAVIVVGTETAAAGAAVRCHQLCARLDPAGIARVNAKVREIAQGEWVTVLGPKSAAS